jgi:EAL domain-containing protein (putative c-di-GMP-specific phosphodiesterase class I)
MTGSYIVQTIIALGHALRLNVTAEGIEDSEQASQLRGQGCTRGQGYFFARPCPPDEVDFGLATFFARRAA